MTQKIILGLDSFFDPTLPSTGKMFEPQSTDLYWDEQDPGIYQNYKDLVSQFWHASEVSLKSDKVDFADSKRMTDVRKELFFRAIAQLIILDTVASKVTARLTKIIRNAGAVALIDYQSSQETIHNESYTYILSSLVSKEKVQEIKAAAKQDPLVLASTMPIIHVFNSALLSKKDEEVTPMDVVKTCIAIAALEGIRFTNGFVPFYKLNQDNLMQGVGTIIQFINRDETKHSWGMVLIAKKIIEEYNLSLQEVEEFTIKLYTKVVEAEKALSDSFFADYPGMNTVQAKQYVEFRANSILGNLGFEQVFDTVRNPMRWITTYNSDKMGNKKTDFFEKRENDYKRVDKQEQGFDDL